MEIRFQMVSNRTMKEKIKHPQRKNKSWLSSENYSRLDFSKVIPSITKETNFIFSVWKGVEENENDLLRNKHELTKESFLKATYNLDLLKIKIPLEGEDDNGRQRILNRIINTFPLEIDTVKENRISGEFYIYDIEINDLLLAHMVLNLELFNIYLFIQESSSSVAMKKKNLKVYFRRSGKSTPFP